MQHHKFTAGGFSMVVSVGIDVSKDKHDCFIVSSEGEVLADVVMLLIAVYQVVIMSVL